MEKNTNSPTWSPFQGSLASWLAREQVVDSPKATAGKGWPLLLELSESSPSSPLSWELEKIQVFPKGSRQGPTSFLP